MIKQSVICKIRQPKVHSTIISHIVSQRYYVTAETKIGLLAEELAREKEIQALGVVDGIGHTVGMIVTSDFFALLGRPYGVDVLTKRPVEEIMIRPKAFNWNRNLFSIAETLEDSLRSRREEYFSLHKEDNGFAGIFSTRDLLIYLSDITTQDISAARLLQQRIVHQNTEHTHPRYRLLCGSRMAKEVGGDFYYHKKLDEHRSVIIICDVAGKGFSASLITALLWGVCGQFDFSAGLEELIRGLNETLLGAFQGEKFITGIFLELDTGTGKGEIFDMGHGHNLLYREDRFYILRNRRENPPIGFLPELAPLAATISLKPQDMVLFYTDGLTEQTDPEGNEYDLRRLKRIIADRKGMKPARIKNDILNDFYRFRSSQPQHDDVTVLLLHYQKEQRE